MNGLAEYGPSPDHHAQGSGVYMENDGDRVAAGFAVAIILREDAMIANNFCPLEST
jgi:hypothetical protein